MIMFDHAFGNGLMDYLDLQRWYVKKLGSTIDGDEVILIVPTPLRHF